MGGAIVDLSLSFSVPLSPPESIPCRLVIVKLILPSAGSPPSSVHHLDVLGERGARNKGCLTFFHTSLTRAGGGGGVSRVVRRGAKLEILSTSGFT